MWSRVKLESPHCILFKCICHSLALRVEKTFEQRPSSVGFLSAEISAWFSKSSLRREEYKDLFNNITDEDVHSGCKQSGGTSCKLPFLTLCPTRWLVRGEVLQRMPCNWNHLKSYFSTSVFYQSCRYKARTLADMLFDDVNYLYICFLTPVVKEVDKINKFFLATNADPEEMTRQLHMHYASQKLRVFD